MTRCKVNKRLIDYRANDLHPAEPADLEAHLSLCRSCVEYLKSYEEIVRLSKGAFSPLDEPVSADVPEELVRAILASRLLAQR